MSGLKHLYFSIKSAYKHFIKFKKDCKYFDWYINYRPRLLKYNKLHEGHDCFIIGNGPSITHMDLDPLNQYYTFGLNKVYLLFDKINLQLSYHVAVNPLVIDQMKDIIENNIFQCPSFISYEGSEGLFNNVNNVEKILTEHGAEWSFYQDLCRPISEGYTVTYVAMQIAYYMGFKRIFLIGVYHSYKQVGKPNAEQKYNGNDVNHFHPDYFKGQSWHLADLEGNEASYAMAKHFFHTNGREIFDATLNGKLTLFSKIDYHQALLTAKKK